MTYEELKKQKDFNVNLNYSFDEVAILGPPLDTFGGDDPVVTISKSEPFNYHPRDYHDTMLDLEDWREAVKLAQELAMTPLNERGKAITINFHDCINNYHDCIKQTQKALQQIKRILGRD